MSATEIIQQLEELPPQEQRKVLVYLQEHLVATPPTALDSGVSEEFKGIADEVLTKNAGLFRKLAQ